ncbi:SdpI/YhfL protein family protein [Daejeonella rubra]|uniref:SdpI/YhfL protein family protein n=1 Tax=Daejeonella rubra TaxID=990371 RepID=A0A1G9T7M9_9SPHI|nr:SdpI family protein [Daejeonella rubra]SDM43656.1 SdpI/YhfL protein family protein [Daejeonella rubra]
MNFDNPPFSIPIITGLIFVIAGIIMIKFPPKKINSLYGYRTFSSMKSQERWDFSQRYAAKELMKFGFILTVSSLIGLVFDLRENIGVIIGLGFMLIAIIFLLIRIENAIKIRFGKD